MPVRIVMRHGPDAPEDLWQADAERGAPVRADAALPDVRRSFRPNPRFEEAKVREIAAEGRRARVLLSVEDGTHPEAQERIATLAAYGFHFRLHPKLPSWFWVNDDETVGLPLTWGEAWPTSVMAVSSPAVAGLARVVYDHLWAQAWPWRAEPRGWDSVLAMLAAGATVEAAARALGISPRTARRRLAEAMEHYGVEGMFALGAAWRADPARAGAE
ncbi:helix-turn-helix domain-containing protein [Nocardioides sp. TF02-7]|uniref:helix-turn-helix domain-containing protein n=1 Tax=Nocardioides sp. TF02-7 TaxID=2917724 RepID=UPI001F0635E1|nr:helix-turn-helix domain-containing protein [Nocardioides sp. TF02-7]UMG94441.1 helix-turn-helix domain-containing protein [Nocardioides sp. TF02-7]